MNAARQDRRTEGRRPLKVREVGLARRCAAWLSGKSVTPNQISIASVGFALLSALCLLMLGCWAAEQQAGPEYEATVGILALPALAALFIQCRLLCNLFDGMVAVEGGKSTASGELFNDVPDRIADPIVLVAAGYAAGSIDWGPAIGWYAGLMAVMTAYMRTLVASIGAPVDFQGPMAKQHRMAVMTAASVLTAVEATFRPPGAILLIALIVIIVGCALTVYRRCRAAYRYLENRGTPEN